MLRASTIDGFGWFEPADFRRAWLFFDQVDYILPEPVLPPFLYPPQVLLSDLYQVTRTPLDPEQLQTLIARSTADTHNLGFRRLVESAVPKADLHYAGLVVRHDGELAGVARPEQRENPVWALAYLINKLVLHAALTGSVPILGRRYATDLLARKLDDWREAQLGSAIASPATPAQGLSVSAFAAGLSMGFLSDEALMSLSFDTLRAFKAQHHELLHRHQLHLLEVADQFNALPIDPEFDQRVASLRAEAERRRHDLETEARAAWRAAGLDVARNAMVAGSTALVTGLAVLRGSTWAELLSVGIPAVVAGVGTAAASTLDAAAKVRGMKKHAMAYLFESAKLNQALLPPPINASERRSGAPRGPSTRK